MVLGALLIGAGAGCVGSVPAQGEDFGSRAGEVEMVYLVEELELGERPAAQTGAPANEAGNEPEAEVCSCETQACRDAWTSENFGCNVCVVVPCQDSSTLHACHFCDD